MRRPLFVAVMCAISVLVLSSGAHAYFRSSGSGSGAAATGTLQPATLVALVTSDTPTSTLVPGGSADLILKVNNPSSSNVTLVGIAPKAGGTVTPSLPGCTTSGVALATIGTLSITLTPGSNTVHINNGATMSTASVTGCQGSNFSIPITITVQQ
ncbi:MAG: hypothetical protein QOD01_842 [Actinomycetota bacterium]|nr:hypothetical protein [Actinomycetota bacterium]